MSTSEDCSQLPQTPPNHTHDDSFSKDCDQTKDAQNIDSDLEISNLDSISQNEMNIIEQDDLINSNISFYSLPNYSHTSLDTTPDAHTLDLPPSSPDPMSQDSQNPDENSKDIEEFANTFDPEPSSSLNRQDHDSDSFHEISDIDDSSDEGDSIELDMDEHNFRYGPNSFDQLPYTNYMLTAHDQLRICLDKNLQYQAWIKHQLQLIEYVEMKLREDQEKLQTLAKNATKGTRAQAKNMITLRKFFPYFRDQNGLPPPVDKSAIKNEAHQYGLYDKPSSKWTDKERQDLAKGVRLQNLEALCRPMLLELENVTDTRGREIKREIELIKRKPEHELELNLEGVEWDKLAIDMTPNRHPVECKLQWIQIDHPLVSRKCWNKQEDKALLKLAKENKERDWNMIAMSLKSNRTPVQCLQRYQTALNTEHVKREWSGDDDEKLREAVARCGVGNWQEVANFMGNSHTGAQCLNRWDKTIKPTFRKGKWTEEEDDLLKRGVDMYGIGNWKKIASIVTSRTDVQCRERWVNILDPTIDHGKWTREEDEILLRFVAKFGPGKWSQLASVMGSRTDNMVMRRWEKLNKPGVVAKYRLLRLKAKFARGADSKVKPTLEPEDLDISILPEKAREKVRRIKRSAGKIRRHSSRTAYDCPYEKDRPYAKPIRPTKKYATLGRPKGSKSRLIFRESDTDVLGSDISILEGEVVQFTDGKIPIKKSKLRRKRRHTDVDTDSSDDDKGRSRTKPTKKRHKRRDGEVIGAGSDADISCSDDEAPYKRGDVSGLGGLSSFLSFLPLRGDSVEFFNNNFPRWDYQTRPHFPVIPHKPKGKQRGRPRETFWDKTFPSFQESQTTRKSLPVDDSMLEAEITQYMSSHAPSTINSPPPHIPTSSLLTLHSQTCSLPSLPSVHTPSTTEPPTPTPTSPVLTPSMAKLSLLAKQALKMNDPEIAAQNTVVKSAPPSNISPFLSPGRKEDLDQIAEFNLTEGELNTTQSGNSPIASVIARRKNVPRKQTTRVRAKRGLKRSSKRISNINKTKRAKIC